LKRLLQSVNFKGSDASDYYAGTDNYQKDTIQDFHILFILRIERQS